MIFEEGGAFEFVTAFQIAARDDRYPNRTY